MSEGQGFRIDQMTAAVRNVVRQYELDDGNGVINPGDAKKIEQALARKDIDPQAKEIIKSVQSAMQNPLAVPRDKATADKIHAAMSQSNPYDALSKLNPEDMKALKIDERVQAVRDIANLKGAGMWEKVKGVNDAKEQTILRILDTAPEHQKGAVFEAIVKSGLNQKLMSAIDGAEYQEYVTFARTNVWGLERPEDIARTMRELGIFNRQGTVDTLTRVRHYRSEAFAEQVVSYLYSTGSFESLLPFIYWAPSRPSCQEPSDILGEFVWQGKLELIRKEHAAELEQFLGAMPRPDGREGPTTRALRTEFERRHDIKRNLAALNLGMCAVEVANYQAQRAEEERRQLEEENRRLREQQQGGGVYGGGSSSGGLDDYVGGGQPSGSRAGGLDDYAGGGSSAPSTSVDSGMWSALQSAQSTMEDGRSGGRGITKPELMKIVSQQAWERGNNGQLSAGERAALERAIEKQMFGSQAAEDLARQLARGTSPARLGIKQP